MWLEASQSEIQIQVACRPAVKKKFKPKTKTGCHTCRIRRVKCDEKRPACNRCVSTGRTCDGYPSIFQAVKVGPSPPCTTALASRRATSLSVYHPKSSIITIDEINALSIRFTTKNVKSNISYHAEAQAVLAKLSDPAIRQAFVSLRTLHQEYWARRNSSGCPKTGGEVAHLHRGLDAYNSAITNLASRLAANPSHESIHAVLLCCQLFVSIETTLGDFTAAIRHFIYGLRIMHQYRGRPAVSEDGQILLKSHANLPLLDSFIIKLFASGRPDDQTSAKVGSPQVSPMPIVAWHIQARNELAMLSTHALEYLEKVSNLQTADQIMGLQTWKAQILSTLDSWDIMYAQPLRDSLGRDTLSIPVLLNTVFSLLLHGILKVVVSLSMSCSPSDLDLLQEDFQSLTGISHFASDAKKWADSARRHI